MAPVEWGKEGVSTDKKMKSDLTLPTVVVKASSIDVGADVRLKSNVNANKNRTEETYDVPVKGSHKQFQAIFEGILRRKMKESWLNTSYQRAIWNARRRLTRGEILEDLPDQEKHIVASFMSPRMKPDLTRWLRPKKKVPHGHTLAQLRDGSASSSTYTHQRDLARGYLPEHFIGSFRGEHDIRALESDGLQVYPIEFISLSDRLTLHEPPWLTTLRHGTETDNFDQFGLCYGCFHKKGPHYHYHAPIRTGGGFTIYRRHPFLANEHKRAVAKHDTPRMITHGERYGGRLAFDHDMGNAALTDDFTTHLFHTFLDNGGNPNPLKEYLESNFDPDVLKEFESLGINVQLIKDYAEFLRRHIREKLAKTLEKQEGIVKDNDLELQLVKRFIEVTSAGGDLEMLLALLENGPHCDDILRYEKSGGNVELLQHYASRLLEDFAGIDEDSFGVGDFALTMRQRKLKADLIRRLRNYLENENDHKRATLLLEYMSKGGRLDALVEYVDKGASHPGNAQYEMGTGDASLVREYAEKFPDKAKLLRDIEKFVKDHFRSYSSANLLQKYIENGGEVKVLKQYIANGCSFSTAAVQHYVKRGGNMRLLQDIGQAFATDETMREDLEQFPDDPKVLEAYIRRGGNFPRLVNAIANAMGDPLIEDYVKRRTDAALHDFKSIKGTKWNRDSEGLHSKSASSPLEIKFFPPPNSPTGERKSHARSASYDDRHAELRSPSDLANNLLPRLLETARAELTYDKLMAADEVRRQNEGAFLARTVDFNREMLPVTSVSMTARRRHPAYSLFRGDDARDSATVSLLTGKRRPRLWKPPPPFKVKKSQAQPTYPQSPFSQDRSYDIYSLTEDHITHIEKQQRHELDVLRRNYNSKDFRENWKVAITSPCGSVISEHDSTTAREFEETRPAYLKRLDDEETRKNEKRGKLCRRERQRAKMKALKHKSKEKVWEIPASRQSSTSSSVLTVPQEDKMEPLVSLPKEAKAAENQEVLNVENEKPKTRTRRKILTLTTVASDMEEREREVKLDVDRMVMPDLEPKIPDGSMQQNDEGTISSSDHISLSDVVAKHEVPPLPIYSNSDEEEPESPYETAFGKSAPHTPRSKMPIFPEMIENPQTQVSEDQKNKQNLKLPHKQRRAPKPKVPDDMEREDHSSEEDEDERNAVDDVLRKYCIIREDRLPRYRLIFDKHLMLREMRIRERVIKAQRANNMLKEDEFEVSLEDEYGPAHEDLKKYEFLTEILAEKISDVEHEIAEAKKRLSQAKSLTARELLSTNKRFLKKLRKKKQARTHSVFGRVKTADEDFQQGAAEALENTETAIGSVSQSRRSYDYDHSARIGFESRNSSTPMMEPRETPRASALTPLSSTTELPLEDFTDEQVINNLDAKSRKQIAWDPAVKHNMAAISVLKAKLKRMKGRYRNLEDRRDKQMIEAEKEKEATTIGKRKRDRFVRQQSGLYQVLHPVNDPVLSTDDVPEALRDVNGEISRADSGMILEALDFPRHGDGVNFRVFCILAALSESAFSIQPLVRRLVRTRDARAFNLKMDKCKEIYCRLLGPNLESLQLELRSSGFSSTQYHQAVKKLTRDNDGLSFLDFVTYVPLFLDIHQRIVSNPLTA